MSVPRRAQQCNCLENRIVTLPVVFLVQGTTRCCGCCLTSFAPERSLSPSQKQDEVREDHEGFEGIDSSCEPPPSPLGITPDSRVSGDGQGQVGSSSDPFCEAGPSVISLSL